jgi:hypothetical protein
MAGSRCVLFIEKPIEQLQAYKNIVQTSGQLIKLKDDKFTQYCYWQVVNHELIISLFPTLN